jgi:hypothetical protein
MEYFSDIVILLFFLAAAFTFRKCLFLTENDTAVWDSKMAGDLKIILFSFIHKIS